MQRGKPLTLIERLRAIPETPRKAVSVRLMRSVEASITNSFAYSPGSGSEDLDLVLARVAHMMLCGKRSIAGPEVLLRWTGDETAVVDEYDCRKVVKSVKLMVNALQLQEARIKGERPGAYKVEPLHFSPPHDDVTDFSHFSLPPLISLYALYSQMKCDVPIAATIWAV